MSTLVIKNLPEALHEKLRAQAVPNHRSVTKDVVTLIEPSVGHVQCLADLPLPLMLKSGFRPSIDEIEAAIADGQK